MKNGPILKQERDTHRKRDWGREEKETPRLWVDRRLAGQSV